MGGDYYKTLKINRTQPTTTSKKPKETSDEVTPRKNSAPGAKATFKQISEAYDVLSNLVKHQIYDVYGEDAIRAEDVYEEFVGGGVDEGKAAMVEQRLVCTLKELRKGSKRKMQISRMVP